MRACVSIYIYIYEILKNLTITIKYKCYLASKPDVWLCEHKEMWHARFKGLGTLNLEDDKPTTISIEELDTRDASTKD